MSELWIYLICAASSAGALVKLFDRLEGAKKEPHNCANSHAVHRVSK